MITKEELKEFGMDEGYNGNSIFPLQKRIGGTEDRPISICVTNMRNTPEICLMTPDGGCLYLQPETIEELKIFEKCIQSWEPKY